MLALTGAENSTEQREHLPGKDKPSCVHKTYLNQFEKDFTAFLRSRSEEMIPGGCMVLTIFGRDENIDSSVKHSPTIREFFGMMLNDMVLEVTTLVNHKGQDQCC